MLQRIFCSYQVLISFLETICWQWVPLDFPLPQVSLPFSVFWCWTSLQGDCTEQHKFSGWSNHGVFQVQRTASSSWTPWPSSGPPTWGRHWPGSAAPSETRCQWGSFWDSISAEPRTFLLFIFHSIKILFLEYLTNNFNGYSLRIYLSLTLSHYAHQSPN